MKWLLLFFLLIVGSVSAQNSCLVSGRITDGETGKVVGDVIINAGKMNIATAGSDGCFSLCLPVGRYVLECSHLAYEKLRIPVNLRCDTFVEIVMNPLKHALEEAVVRSVKRNQGISGLLGGRIELDMDALQVLPKFIGSNDPMKILQLTPGVQTASEGESGMFIRGGENGHNLILWNDAPIYNASHLLGSFSIFNTGHIGKFKLYKSNISAEYGGRLASVISVESPEKIPEKLSVCGNVGIISSQLTLGIPIREKHAFYLSGRKTYVGFMLKPLMRRTMTGKGSDMPYGYEFQDVNLTYTGILSLKDRVTVNAYWGLDNLEVGEPDYALAGNMKWSNLAVSAQWRHTFDERMEMKHSAFMSRYMNKVNMVQDDIAFRLPSSILDFGWRGRWNYKWEKHSLTVGGDYIHHKFRPQIPFVRMDSLELGSGVNPEFYTNEFGIYIMDNYHITSNCWVEAGLRYTASLQTGKYDHLTYSTQGMLVDSVHYGKGERVNYRQGWEPRISLNYNLPTGGLLQLSYNRLFQYVHLISISGVGLPTDFWIPSAKTIPKERSDNYSIGFFQALWQNRVEFSVEGYYRRMKNQMEYDNGIVDLLNQKYILEQSLLYGDGKAYGGEVMVKYDGGKLNGWVSYTLGWSKRSFPNIEEGRVFPAKHDRRHDLSVVAAYRLNRKWDFSSVFVYGTGNAYTEPVGMHIVGGNPVKEYGPYNGARMPHYHRMDISANYWFFKEKNRESGINFSVYNVYRRQNPLYIFVVAKKETEDRMQIKIQKKYKRLYDIIPSVSWTFKF